MKNFYFFSEKPEGRGQQPQCPEYQMPQTPDRRGKGLGQQGNICGGAQGPGGAMEQPQLPFAYVQSQGTEEDQGKKGKQPVHETAQPGDPLPQGPEQVKKEGQNQAQSHCGKKAPGLRPRPPHPPQSLRKKPPAGRSSS